MERTGRAKASPVVHPVKKGVERKPAMTHPWRRQRIGSVRKWEQQRRGRRLAVGAYGRPSRRSGLPAAPTASRRIKQKTTNQGDMLVSVIKGTFLKSFDR